MADMAWAMDVVWVEQGAWCRSGLGTGSVGPKAAAITTLRRILAASDAARAALALLWLPILLSRPLLRRRQVTTWVLHRSQAHLVPVPLRLLARLVLELLVDNNTVVPRANMHYLQGLEPQLLPIHLRTLDTAKEVAILVALTAELRKLHLRLLGMVHPQVSLMDLLTQVELTASWTEPRIPLLSSLLA